MIAVYNDKINIDNTIKNLNKINVIKGNEKSFYFSDNLVTGEGEFPYNIKHLHSVLQRAEKTNFILTENAIVNIQNVKEVVMEYFQYAGISIYKCCKKDAELYVVSLLCTNGKTESISYHSFKQAQACFNEINKNLKDVELTV